MIRLYLSRGVNRIRIPMQLPITPGEAGKVFSQLDSISTQHKTKIQHAESGVFSLIRYIRNVDIDSSDGFAKLNELAKMFSVKWN